MVAGVSRAAAPRIAKYSPPAANAAVNAAVNTTVNAPVAAPVATLPHATTLPTPAPVAAPTPITTPITTQPTPETSHTIPPAFAHVAQHTTETAGPQATLPSQLVPPPGEKPLVKPKPAKPYGLGRWLRNSVRRVRAKPDGFITTVGNPVGKEDLGE